MTKKTIHQLRKIAQDKGVPFNFSDDTLALSQKITMVDDALASKPEVPPVVIINNVAPSTLCTQEQVLEMLAVYRDMGVHVTFSEDTWHMRRGAVEDSGTMHMPAHTILRAAEKLCGR